jgi:hypothetical protein
MISAASWRRRHRSGAAPGTFNWSALAPGEAEELERLVETMLDAPGFFARRRDERRAQLQLDQLARRARTDAAPLRVAGGLGGAAAGTAR